MLNVSNAKHRPAGYQRAKVLDSELLFIESIRKEKQLAAEAPEFDVLRVGAGISPSPRESEAKLTFVNWENQAESATLRFMKLTKKPRSQRRTRRRVWYELIYKYIVIGYESLSLDYRRARCQSCSNGTNSLTRRKIVV